MKKASNIILLVGAIMAFVSAVSMFICGIMFIAGIGFVASIITAEGGSAASAESADMAAEIVTFVYAVIGIVFIFVAILMVVAGIISLIARSKETKGLYIAAIVFGVIGSEVCLVGAILGLIAKNREDNKNIIEVNN